MTENNPNQLLANKYLAEIKAALPGWLTENKKETQDVLEEIEQHVWDKAGELAGNQNISEANIRTAIEVIGTASKIAAEYKRRGTPKVYISKELWPLFTRTMIIVLSLVVGLSAIGLVFNLQSNNIGTAILQFLSGIWTGSLQVALIIILIFVGLSMEGFMPEDFSGRKEEKAASLKDQKIGSVAHSPLKIKDAIFEGTLELVMGIILLTLRPDSLPELLTARFVYYLQIMGIINVIQGPIIISRGLIGNRNVTRHQLLMIVHTFINLLGIPIIFGMKQDIALLLPNPAIFGPEALTGFATLLNFVIGIVIFATVVELIQVVLLKGKYEQYIKDREFK